MRRAILAALLLCFAAGAAFWPLSYFVRLEHFLSRERYCLHIHCRAGVLRFQYDGGPDVWCPSARYFHVGGLVVSSTAVRGWQYFDVHVPLWLPTLTCLVVAAPLFAVPPYRRWRRRRRGLCVRCAYDLTGNVSGRCPECGERVPEAVRQDAGHA